MSNSVEISHLQMIHWLQLEKIAHDKTLPADKKKYTFYDYTYIILHKFVHYTYYNIIHENSVSLSSTTNPKSKG